MRKNTFLTAGRLPHAAIGRHRLFWRLCFVALRTIIKMRSQQNAPKPLTLQLTAMLQSDYDSERSRHGRSASQPHSSSRPCLLARCAFLSLFMLLAQCLDLGFMGAINLPADVGDQIGEYTLYNGTGFLNAIERDCL